MQHNDESKLLQVQNVVSTAYLGRQVDLDLIARHAINIQYNRQKFVAAIIRLQQPKTTTLLFNSGRIVCTGARSIDDSKRASRIIARTIQKILLLHQSDDHNRSKIMFKDFTVQNIVGSFKHENKIDLIAFNYANKKRSFYDPCTFPGLKFKPFTSEKTTVIIFISGKIIITGLKEISKLNDTYNYVNRLLLKFKRPFPYLTLF
jgi:transcription initiation factor TFIID TATA-box-binding protein